MRKKKVKKQMRANEWNKRNRDREGDNAEEEDLDWDKKDDEDEEMGEKEDKFHEGDYDT